MTLPAPDPSPEHGSFWPPGWACGLCGCAGAGALLVLIGVGALDPRPGLIAAVFIAAVAAFLVSRVRAGAAPPDSPPVPTPAQTQRRAALAAALESLPDPLMVISAPDGDALPGGRILFTNAAARAMIRSSGEGDPLATAVRHPEVLEVVDEALFGGMESEAFYEAGGASERSWRALAKPLALMPGEVRMALLLLTDQTDARRNERMRSDFLANASHELRTPLASLSGFIETLRGHAKDDALARERFLEIMAAQADRMARMIADLMSLSRIELNEHIAPQGEVDVALAVTDVVDALTPQTAAAGGHPRAAAAAPRAGPGGGRSRSDRAGGAESHRQRREIRRPPGKGDDRCGGQPLGPCRPSPAAEPQMARLNLLTPDTAEGPFVVLRVRDSGPGIAREHLPRLTERFYRVEGQKSGERLGTGLGLAIVKHIVNRHSGGLAVETTPGCGAAFIVYFPVQDRSPLDPASPGPSQTA